MSATQGQRWVEYDLRPYASRAAGVEHPERTVVDWILRETGTDRWFTEPMGLMSASRGTLRVYHVPDVQRSVRSVVDRFVDPRGERIGLSVRLMTIGNPNWRSIALPRLRALAVRSPGVDAWLISKEDAAVLSAQLVKRIDCTELDVPDAELVNGQSRTIDRLRTRSYIRSVRPRDAGPSGYQAEPATLREGYSLQFSPLADIDSREMEVVVLCRIDQVERFVPVTVEMPPVPGVSSRVRIEVPQMSSWTLHERFRWPLEETLLVSCGVVASPRGDPPSSGLPLGLGSGAVRADALLWIECKTRDAVARPSESAARNGTTIRGRY
ncbi:MAG: hypothetical protein FJ297_02895 [Planctomycetes bacterium]|nr:hypothetical protein [Planctomycetota bacterium]